MKLHRQQKVRDNSEATQVIIPAVVDGLASILDLEDAAIRGESGDGQIVPSSDATHC